MKKTLLSIVAGITVVSTAFALPTPGDRRAVCMEKPLERVWVEKTETCVPINPCESKDEGVKGAYCIEPIVVANGKTGPLGIERYVKNVMKTSVKSIEKLTPEDKSMADAVLFFATHTKDGGYYVFRFLKEGFDSNMKDYEWFRYRPRMACWAYGKEYQNVKNEVACLDVNTQSECDDIADFASRIGSDIMTGKLEQLGVKVCWLHDPKAK